MKNQMEINFLEFKQDNLCVAVYEAKVTELASFVPDQVDTDEKRAKRFQHGLKTWIRSKVVMFEMTSYASIVQKATITESDSDMSQKERDGKKRKVETSEGGQRQVNCQSRFNKRPEFPVGKKYGLQKTT